MRVAAYRIGLVGELDLDALMNEHCECPDLLKGAFGR
jgi:hypothetical protein